MLAKSKTILICSLFLVACRPEAASNISESERSAIQQSVTSIQDTNAPKGMTMKDQIAPPTPGDVIYAVFNQKGDGSDAYEVENGSWAHYWYGHGYELDGRSYFTGFLYQTPDRYGTPGEEDLPDPETKATIAQASFVRAPAGSDKQWEFAGAQPFIGEFGGSEKGNSIDSGKPAQTYFTPAGDYLLAVPTWTQAGGGTREMSAEVFLLNHEDRRWSYVGNVATGEDNGDGCASDAQSQGLPPCVKSSAKLEFVPLPGSDMPLIRAVLEGTTIQGLGKTRTLGPQDAREYRFDAETGSYRIDASSSAAS